MRSLLAEHPLLMSLMLGVLAAAALYGWLQTGKRGALIGGLVMLALIPVAWAVAHYWVTDAERLRTLIYDTADAIEANDIERAVRVIGEGQPALLARARGELANYEFTQADVNQIRRLEIIDNTFPPQADVELVVAVSLSDRRGNFADIRVPRRLSLRFEKESDGQWVVIQYDHGPPFGEQRDNFSPTHR